MIDKRIEFDEAWNKYDGETVLFFTAPKEIFDEDYPEAVSMEISIEFPTEHAEASYAIAECSPTRYVEEDDSYEDYDWSQLSISNEDINELIALARKAGWSEQQEVE